MRHLNRHKNHTSRKNHSSHKNQKSQGNQQLQQLQEPQPTWLGWNGPYGGKMSLNANPPTWRGSAVQVCGLWPFVAGTGAPLTGVPLGLHLATASTVCCDPISWFERASLLSNPSMFCLANPGLGKSTVVRRMLLGLAGQGVMPLVLGDTKPDYVDLIEALDGQVLSIGAGRDLINPLDTGGVAKIATRLPEHEKERVLAEAHARQVQMLSALIQLVRKGPVTDREEAILSETVRLHAEHHASDPVIGDLLDLIRQAPEELHQVALSRGDIVHYEKTTENLEASLKALTIGRWGRIFGYATTTPMRLDKPVVFDVSDLDQASQDIQGAVLLTCWSYGFAQVNLAQTLADNHLTERQHYFIVMDELWRILRAGFGMVDRIDELTRLNRARGVGQAMITHTLNDLEALPNKADISKAKGFVSRSGMVLCGGLTGEEVEKVHAVIALSEQEKRLLVSWQAPPSWQATPGQNAIPPGRGKFLIKVAQRPGIPINVKLTNAELALNDTNKLWKNTTKGTNNV